MEEVLLKQILAVLSDCWIVLTQNKKVIKQKNNYFLIHSGTACAYSVYSCESAVLYFLKYLSLASDHLIIASGINKNLHTILPLILHYLSKKPLAKSSQGKSEGKEDIKTKLGQALLQKQDLLTIFCKLMEIPGFDATEELLVSCLEVLEKITEIKIIEFNVLIINICSLIFKNAISKEKAQNNIKIFYQIERIFGTVWSQVIKPANQEETNLFLQIYNSWKQMLVQYYSQNQDCSAQFQLTFNTLLSEPVTLISECENSFAKILAKLSITTIKEMLALPNSVGILIPAMTQYLQDLTNLIQSQSPKAQPEKIDMLYIISVNCAFALSPRYNEDIAKTFISFLELFENLQVNEIINSK